ncbi:MAG TPA: crosslink repair DNA glycosylase YcaQ family protein [Acidimicrobiales bacterium]|nr:crosslink repair DNA glycosylase YcaQ family protein [Acidimicrobiales bacterium]
MTAAAIPLTREQARRLAYRGQRLAGPRPGRGRDDLLALVRQLGCLQLDPISVVARSHLLVLWSRVGRYDQRVLRRLHEEDRALFEYWAHAASLVPTSDLPIHRWTMERGVDGFKITHVRVRDWLAANEPVARDLVARLERDGPLRTQDLRAFALLPWEQGGWSNDASVALLLEVLSHRGRVLVSRREGSTRWWDVAERCLPPDAPTERLDEAEVVRRATLRSVRALGVANAPQIRAHFTRGRYPGLPGVLEGLVADGVLVPARVEGLRGPAYLHANDAATLDELAPARLALLSPFDNLICDRARTQALWDVEFRIEIYVPAAQRRWGYYVLAVLDGDRIVGRIDAAVDTRTRRLVARSVHHEPGARWSRSRTSRVARRFEELARFVGAEGVEDPTGRLRGLEPVT